MKNLSDFIEQSSFDFAATSSNHLISLYFFLSSMFSLHFSIYILIS